MRTQGDDGHLQLGQRPGKVPSGLRRGQPCCHLDLGARASGCETVILSFKPQWVCVHAHVSECACVCVCGVHVCSRIHVCIFRARLRLLPVSSGSQRTGWGAGGGAGPRERGCPHRDSQGPGAAGPEDSPHPTLLPAELRTVTGPLATACHPERELMGHLQKCLKGKSEPVSGDTCPMSALGDSCPLHTPSGLTLDRS